MAQWDKTQSRELLGLFICVCIALCTTVAHNIIIIIIYYYYLLFIIIIIIKGIYRAQHCPGATKALCQQK